MGAVDQIKQMIASKTFDPKQFPLFIQAMQEVSEHNNELKEELANIENTSINFSIPGVVDGFLKIEGGKLTGGAGKIDDAPLTIEIAEEVARGMVTGETDVASAYMAGDVKLIGDMAEAMKLRPIFEIVNAELGIQTGGGAG
ncbi:MAG: SCP2 sterol-binding domain-containing protein [Euryarchaeota archaeon]|nr:SCP2 sterol-binding domain-containing protein [Euryarchaeota archaeon]